ncbi:TetR/AcrR family transcriptional regulator [Actinomycetes bacterium M1A6_2h]
MTTGSSNRGRRAYGGISAADRDERRRRQLLEAGLEVFGTIGYRNATVRGLCRQAKIADRHFYEYFPSTEDLLIAVYRDCMTLLMSETRTAIDEATADKTVDAVATQALDAFFRITERTQLARVVWMEVLGVSAPVEREYLSAMTEFAQLILRYLKATGVSVESTGDLDPGIVVTGAVGGISHIALTWFLSDYAAERTTVVASAAHYLTGIHTSLIPMTQNRP